MSISLNPSTSLSFRRPFSSLVKRSLTITNNNSQPVAFKVKTTAPKLYCARPNQGRVEPWETVEVSITLCLKEDPPFNTKCKDKFLIQSTIITPEKEALPVQAIWSSPDANDEGKVHQQKLRVRYLPAEGQTLEEEDENSVAMASDNNPNPPPTYADAIAELIPAPSRVQDLVPEPDFEPPAVPVPRQVSSAPITAVPVISAPTTEPLIEPPITEPTPTLQVVIRQEGIPLQVVVIIAFGVFILTYLFF